MKTDEFDPTRRSFLSRLLALLAAAGAGLFVPLQRAFGMGDRPILEGMHAVEGEVRVNNAIVKPGSPVGPDDTITTGAKGRAIFVVGKNAFLLHENSRVELSSKADKNADAKGKAGIKTLRMAAGGLLSVFSRGKKTIITSTAICGVRGTGIYIEAEADRTYVCTCYGEVELVAAASPEVRETVKTTHHQAPRYIYAKGAKHLMEKAGMLNHTDEELIMLESLVNRRPPFVHVNLFGDYRDSY
jgi:hypothetical protein